MDRHLAVAYEAAMRRRGLASGTIVKRAAELRYWRAWIGDGWATAGRRDVEAWLDSRELCARSRYCALSHLEAFYRWAIREELTTSNPAAAVERPRLPRRLPRPVRRGDVELALHEAPTAELAAAVALMAWCGLRCCEVAGLRWADVDLAERVVLVRGKGDKERVVGLPVVAVRHLAALSTTAGPVWPNAAGGHLTAARVSQLVGAHLRRCGLTASAHQLRHTYATALYRATGGDLLAVQQALGHASPATTAIYAAADHRRALEVAQALD